MEVQILWNIKAAICVAFPTCDLTGKWVQICTRIERYRPIVRWRQVVWTKPVTGSYMQERVLRDDTGHLIMAFSVPTQCKSNNQAEAMAALYAIEWCNRAGYDKYDMELGLNGGYNYARRKRHQQSEAEKHYQTNCQRYGKGRSEHLTLL
ncbi:hypothetical protein H5410_044333 [Solanum commersonii]|uniref:RNase H type-1 domain-containing protein n=1 Tax=Solanum commersonii TaxID=4109 RepID=A0A9J5X6S1_SOLCO|nr:hypothetical protein H5410_044333 [Solanum commersonii]